MLDETSPAKTLFAAVTHLAAAWRQRRFALLVGAGVVVNGLVCGVLASPYDRFQARVVWLVPFLVIAGWLVARRRDAGRGAPTPKKGTP